MSALHPNLVREVSSMTSGASVPATAVACWQSVLQGTRK
jgi:hypothetical protein